MTELGDPLKRTSRYTGRFALTTVAAAALWLAVPEAWALGLGRLNVQSALGESLRAEIDVTSLTPEESANLRINVAPPESYRAAGVDYNAVLPGTKAQLLRRPDGRPYVRLTSDRAVQEPFVDVILEISWSTGRLVREYTLLFDPPARNLAEVPAPVTEPVMSAAPVAPDVLVHEAPVPSTAPVPVEPVPFTALAPVPQVEPDASAPSPAAETQETQGTLDSQGIQETAPRTVRRAAPASPRSVQRAPAEPRVTERKPTPRPAEAARSAEPVRARPPATTARSEGADDYRVRQGDSLSRIAGRHVREGVSLDQMLVSLYRGNGHAFIGNNMNRLKAGVVLTVPSVEQAQAVSASEAREVIQAQSADFGAYRQRLAAAVPQAPSQGSARVAGGKVEANVQDRKQDVAPTPDKLTLSKGSVAAKSAPEVKVAKEREKQDADTRVAELSRNVEELRRLAGTQSAPAAASPAPDASSGLPGVTVNAPVSSPTAPAVPEDLAASSVSTTSASAAASGAASDAATVAPAVPAAASTASAASPATAASRPSTPKPAVATADGPDVLTAILEDNPLALGGAAALVAALAGFGIFRFTRRSKKDSGETSFLESRLQPDSFFGASGGQRIDTRDAGGASSSMSYSLSQLDAIGDVDPVAEADVYLAYGRDLQAEEILKEAMRSSPDRLAIRTKLLEVYAKRRDTKGFELLATQLYSLTRGEGEDWAKAQELGQQIDPENPLYRPGGAPLVGAGDAGERPEPLGASTMPQSVLPTASQFERAKAEVSDHRRQLQRDAVDSQSAVDLDLDLNIEGQAPRSAASPSGSLSAAAAGKYEPKVQQPESDPKFDSGLLQFDSVPELPAAPAVAASPAGPSSGFAMDFDLSAISLDLNAPGDAQGAAPAVEDADLSSIDLGVDSRDSGGDPLARKLELAEEFRQIGDMEGARDLLQEVIARANGALKSKAEGMLNSLA
jgi:pilus assembly protein FimV